MYRRIDQRGSVLAGAFLVSVALGIAMIGLMSLSRNTNKQAESLLSKSHLSRIAHEKFTQDLLALNKNADVSQFGVSITTFPMGEAETFVQAIPDGSLYIVVVATLTKTSPEPRHIRLETRVELSAMADAQTQAVPAAPKSMSFSAVVDDIIRRYVSEDDPQFQEVKQQVMEELKAQLGPDVFSSMVVVEPAQYRGPSEPTAAEPGVFTMQPVSLNISKEGPRVRLWKETTY